MNPAGPRGLMIAAPSSGSGKTTVTLALLRALRNRGVPAVSAKSGPDYIDPKFHEAASGLACINLDAWAMESAQIQSLAASQMQGANLLVVEAAMGLFDGAANGRGSAADLAACLGLPVVLVVDCAKQAQSVAALVSGFASFRQDVPVAGILLNKVGSPRHEAMLRRALAPLGIPVVGALPRLQGLMLPERHLGLVQAEEHPELSRFLDQAAEHLEAYADLSALSGLALPLIQTSDAGGDLLPPLGQRIAVASDVAFAFAYPHLLSGWREAGADLSFFSPLADEGAAADADAIYLPGGYPELHAGRLAANEGFRGSLHSAAARGALIYGECGGYMVLGDGLIDAQEMRHQMLGLLPLETSFATRKRHLGYRELSLLHDVPVPGWSKGMGLAAHEFHYASIVHEGAADRLFSARDAEGETLPEMGLRTGKTLGSFAHLICARGCGT
ncbi:cobyrinate a,c-diamide synthase [Roseibium suaedae]|uniref:Hydrogenobyrinate a,c-diamide synthase n=1 Tax=Roseibium suaedae TaxID=735517 RepID=A0A1M6ZR05_9HYPH|nr:cobyrinate a,c-diamide synthase [Roseibium suaedae]SHL32948.1 hydrogenobyrinic acid a,c-diamide synthase (glutamine-hydrolysing) /cobyrinate a,c-diamide synthase [Roseibium suaedae]